MGGNMMRTFIPGVQTGTAEATLEPKVLIYLEFPFGDHKFRHGVDAVHLHQMLLEFVLPGECSLAGGLAEANLVVVLLLKMLVKDQRISFW